MGTNSPSGLQRQLGLWQLTVTGVGIVIGAGIYVLIGTAASQAGNLVWLSLLLAALMSALTGLSYAELGSMYPTASAEYEFTRRAFNETWGFLAGWLMMGGITIAAAAVSLGFGQYVRHFVDVDVRAGAALLLFCLTAVVLRGIRQSIRLTVLLVLVQVGGLLLVIAAGAPHIGGRDLLSGSPAGVLSASALVFFAFIGFDEVVTLSEETRQPEKTVPAALLIALAISTLLYVLVAIASVSVIGGKALGASDRGLTLVIEHDWGSAAGDVVAVIALAATTNTTLLVMTSSSRLLYGIASRGALPPVLARVSRSTHVPYVAVLASLAGAIVLILPGELDMTAEATDLAIYMVFLFVNLSVIRLRRTHPEVRAGFRVPGTIAAVPVIPVLAIATVAVMMCFISPEAWAIVGVYVGFGVLLWAVRPASGRGANPT
jgi:APA family basic amino acid/polyamine antiporter